MMVRIAMSAVNRDRGRSICHAPQEVRDIMGERKETENNLLPTSGHFDML
jgi:hypothetical protein